MDVFKKLGNYFLGLDIIEDYKIRKQENPKNTKQLNQERNKYIITGKVIPNLLDIGGIIGLGLWELGPTLVGSTLIGGGEALRHSIDLNYLDKRTDYLGQQHKKAIGEFISTLEKKLEQIK